MQSWEDRTFGDLDTLFLSTSDGSVLRGSESKLWTWHDKAWREAGESSSREFATRMWMQHGRHYVYLSRANESDFLLFADYGDLLQLTRTPGGDGRFRLAPVKYEGKATPEGIFDAVADDDDNLLLATKSGLLRFHPGDGRSETIPIPNPGEEINTLCRDEQGRLWAAGENLYVTSDEGRRWYQVKLPMLSKNIMKRVRPNLSEHRGLILVLEGEGAAFLNW